MHIRYNMIKFYAFLNVTVTIGPYFYCPCDNRKDRNELCIIVFICLAYDNKYHIFALEQKSIVSEILLEEIIKRYALLFFNIQNF